MRSILSKITSLTPIAAGAAAGMIVLGIVSIVGGSYDHEVVHNQLAPQKITFPKPAEYPDLKKYEGQQVLSGTQAKAYAEDQIAVDMNKIAGGKTYAQVSDEWIAGGMKSEKLAGERTSLFMGDTLRGLLLNAWGWGQIGSIAILAGILLIAFGAILFLLPVLSWWLNLARAGRETASRSLPHAPAGAAG
ncbi:MAG TPA: hypothetical protein VK790_08170 [Solirubrobacteraceae bacterium]|jgi:hypothetical protein|nr:hypothetical protein [Solirubrobacteraceae bacterium]